MTGIVLFTSGLVVSPFEQHSVSSLMNFYESLSMANASQSKIFRRSLKAFPALGLALLVTFTYGQHSITKIPLPDKQEADAIQVINFGEELFVAYNLKFPKPKTNPFHFYWVTEGLVEEVDFPELKGKLISCITRDSLHNYFHYFEEENKLISLGVIKENRLTGKKETCSPTTVDGRLIGITGSKERVFIYSFEKKAYSLKVTEKVNDKIVNESLYGLSFDLSKFKGSDIAFVPEGSFIGTAQASARIKVFAGPEHIRITFDDPFDEHASSLQNNYRTTLVDINTRTGAVSNKMFTEASKGNFRSFPFSKYLFRTVMWGKEFTLQMFDVEKGELVSTKKIVNDKKYKEQKVFLREGLRNRISQTETLSNMIQSSWACVPFVVVDKDVQTDSSAIVTWGTYYNGHGVQALPLPSVMGLMIMAVGTAIRQIAEGPGLSRYFYLRGSSKEQFQIINDVDLVRSRIDFFELAHLHFDLTRKGYFHSSESVIGTYFDEVNSELWLVEF